MFSHHNKQPARLARLADSEEATQLHSLVEDEKTGFGKFLEAVTAQIEAKYYDFVMGLNLTNEQFCQLDSLALGRIIDYGRAMLVVGMLVQSQFGAAQSKRPADDVEGVINQLGQPTRDEKVVDEFLRLLTLLPEDDQRELKATLAKHVFEVETRCMLAESQGRAVFEPNKMPAPVDVHPN